MDVQQFKTVLKLANREYSVFCSRFQPMDVMMIRASVKHKKYEKVFIYYERPTKAGALFWYSLPDKENESIAKGVAIALEARAKRRGGFAKMGLAKATK